MANYDRMDGIQKDSRIGIRDRFIDRDVLPILKGKGERERIRKRKRKRNRNRKELRRA